MGCKTSNDWLPLYNHKPVEIGYKTSNDWLPLYNHKPVEIGHNYNSVRIGCSYKPVSFSWNHNCICSVYAQYYWQNFVNIGIVDIGRYYNVCVPSVQIELG